MEQDNGIKTTPKGLRIFGLIIKWSLVACAVSIIAWLSLCSIWQKGPKSIRQYSGLEVTQNITQVKTLNEYNPQNLDQLFYISNIYYTEEVNQLQFTLRYNIYADGYSDNPINFEHDKLSFVLSGGSNTYKVYYEKTSKSNMYRHIKLVFENVDFTDIDEYDVDIYYNGRKIGSCIVWKNDGYFEVYKLSKAEKKIDGELYVKEFDNED